MVRVDLTHPKYGPLWNINTGDDHQTQANFRGHIRTQAVATLRRGIGLALNSGEQPQHF